MLVTLSSTGQITIPLSLRRRLNLEPGDQLELDETASILTARPVARDSGWEETFSEWRASAATALQGHTWETQSAAAIVDELRGGPVETSTSPP